MHIHTVFFITIYSRFGKLRSIKRTGEEKSNMLTQRQKQERERNRSLTGASNVGTQYLRVVRNNNASSDQLNTLTTELNALRASRANCTPESTGGYAAELHHKRTFLADAASKGKHNLDVAVGPRGGHGSQGTPDLTVMEKGKAVSEAGLKYRGSAKQTTYDQSNVFDRGRQKIVPGDQLSRVKELSGKRGAAGALKSPDYADTNRNATDRLRYKDVESKPLSKQESMDIVNDASRYAKQAFRNDLKNYTRSGAVTGAAFSTAVSMLGNTTAVLKGQKSAGEAALHVTGDAVKGGVKGAAMGAGTALVKQGLLMTGAKQLARGAAPAAIASSLFEAGTDIARDVKKLSNSEIDGATFALNAVGHTASAATKGAGAFVGAELGAAIGVFGGPIGIAAGGLIGGTIGYLVSSKAVVAIKGWFE
jgi:hypothetical protein